MTSLRYGLLWAGLCLSLASCSDTTVVHPLQGRLPATPGGTDYQAWYDPNLDITWMNNANLTALRNWDDQVAWAESLTLGAVSGWRLPSMDVNGDGVAVNCNDGDTGGCADNEYAYLYWVEGFTSANRGPFEDVQDWYYNSGTDPGEGLHPLCFLFSTGFNGSCVAETKVHAWAVHDGDVGAVRARLM